MQDFDTLCQTTGYTDSKKLKAFTKSQCVLRGVLAFNLSSRQNIRVQSYLVVHLGLQLSVLGLDGAQLLLQRLHPLLQLAVLRLDGVELTHERAVPGKVVLEVPGGVLRLLGLFVERDQGLVNKVKFFKKCFFNIFSLREQTCFRLLELHSLRSTPFRLSQSHVGRARRSTNNPLSQT